MSVKKTLKDCENKTIKFYGNTNKGDLVLIDTKTIHYASILEKGSRELIWLYY